MADYFDPSCTNHLAEKFREVIREWLTRPECREIDAKNRLARKQGDTTTCASHTYCDANMAMHEAWERLAAADLLPAIDLDADSHIGLINAAWDKAKADGFRHEGPEPPETEADVFNDLLDATLMLLSDCDNEFIAITEDHLAQARRVCARGMAARDARLAAENRKAEHEAKVRDSAQTLLDSLRAVLATVPATDGEHPSIHDAAALVADLEGNWTKAHALRERAKAERR